MYIGNWILLKVKATSDSVQGPILVIVYQSITCNVNITN